MNKLHVLTLSWNGLSKLNNLKSGLYNNLSKLKNEKQYDFTWYVRDNGSKDNTVKEVNSWADDNFDIKCLEISHNKDNFSQGMNYLFDKANTKDDDLILLLNNDVSFLDDNSLVNMEKLMTPGVGVVGARLLYTGTNKLQHAGVTFSKKYNSLPFHFRPGQESDDLAKKNRYFQCVTAAVSLVRAKDFKEAGYFNESLFWSFEDISLNLQIGLKKKIAYCGLTEINHDESYTLKKNPVNRMWVNSNVNIFRKLWDGKYKLDNDFYINDPNYNLIK